MKYIIKESLSNIIDRTAPPEYYENRTNWLLENIGEQSYHWECYADSTGIYFSFVKEEDAVLFALVWVNS